MTGERRRILSLRGLERSLRECDMRVTVRRDLLESGLAKYLTKEFPKSFEVALELVVDSKLQTE